MDVIPLPVVCAPQSDERQMKTANTHTAAVENVEVDMIAICISLSPEGRGGDGGRHGWIAVLSLERLILIRVLNTRTP